MADTVEPKLVVLAGQLGTLLGTARARADRYLDRDALSKELTRIRDGAADLLARVKRETAPKKTAAAKPNAKKTAPRPSRGPVDAPGKRHRKPPPQVRLNPRLGEPEGKQMGQKGFKKGSRSGRG